MTKPVGMMSMAEYKVLHQGCPKCGRTPNRLTSINYPAPPDLNIVECMCNWIGTVNELKPQKKETAMPQTIAVDMVIEKYVATRDLIAAKTKALNAELADLKALQEEREAWLMSEMTRVGATSLKTPHGTSYIDTQDSVSVADWPTFFTWVQANSEFEFLTHSVSKTAVKQRLEDGQAPPPGVNYSTFKGIKVRRS